MAGELKASKSQIVPVVTDPHDVPVQFVDWIVTSGIGPAPGLINIDLAALDYAMKGSEEAPQAILQCRLRMSLTTAQNVIKVIQQFLDALKPPAADDSVN